jgi:hypothetical protein
MQIIHVKVYPTDESKESEFLALTVSIASETFRTLKQLKRCGIIEEVLVTHPSDRLKLIILVTPKQTCLNIEVTNSAFKLKGTLNDDRGRYILTIEPNGDDYMMCIK